MASRYKGGQLFSSGSKQPACGLDECAGLNTEARLGHLGFTRSDETQCGSPKG